MREFLNALENYQQARVNQMECHEKHGICDESRHHFKRVAETDKRRGRHHAGERL